MTLIAFDVDGTLTATNAVDAKCYAAAFARTFGFDLPTTDWDVYTHCTDFAIVDEVLRDLRGSAASGEERVAFERAFVEALEAEFAVNPRGFAEIPGARALLEAIGRRADVYAAIATGGTRGSACYKLARIGVDALAFPAAFANDAAPREDIIRLAIARADGRGGNPSDVVYVGDGPWDAKTSAALGLRFIGIIGDAPPDRFRQCGVKVCLEDYRDQEAFFRAVQSAVPPQISELKPRHA